MKTFMLNYRYRVCQSRIKEQTVEMAINGNGIRDTARVLKIDKNTLIRTLKKSQHVDPKIIDFSANRELEVRLEAAYEVEIDK